MPGEPELPGMTEDAAAYAVLGVDIEALGAAVARHWGLNDDVLYMVRRLPIHKPVRVPDSDSDMLRLSASAANEAVDVVTQLPPTRVAAGLQQVVQRYGRALSITVKDVSEGLQAARAIVRQGPAPALTRMAWRTVRTSASGVISDERISGERRMSMAPSR